MQQAVPTLQKPFALLVLAVFTIQIFSPFVLAQSVTAGPEINPSIAPEATPTPTPVAAPQAPPTGVPSFATPVPEPTSIGICTISEFSLDEWNRFRQAAFNFNGKEVTDKSDEKLRAQTPGQNVVVNNYNFPVEDSMTFMKVSELAKIMSRDPAEVAEELGLGDDADKDGKVTKKAVDKEITIAQASAVTQKSGDASVIQKFREFSKGKKPSVQAPGFEAMKVSLPNGKEVALSELYKLQQIRAGEGTPNACLLGSTAFRGRLEYAALLDEDLLLAADKGGGNLNGSPSRLNTNSIRASISNADGHIVIPHTYERAVAGMRGFMYWDMAISAAMAISAIFDVNALNRGIASSKERSEVTKLSPLGKDRDDLSPLGSALKRSYAQSIAKSPPVGPKKQLELLGEMENGINGYLKVLADDGLSSKIYTADERRTRLTSAMKQLGITDPEALKDVGTMSKAIPKDDVELSKAVKGRWDVLKREDQVEFFQELTYNQQQLKKAAAAVEGLGKQREELLKGIDELKSQQSALQQRIDDLVAQDPQADVTNLRSQAKSLGSQISDKTTKELPGISSQLQEASDRASRIESSTLTSGDADFSTSAGQFEGLTARWERMEEEDLIIAQQAAGYGQRRFWTNAVLGALWLGPGRMGLELAGQLTFSSWGKPSNQNGDSLRIFVNNPDFARDFRKGTDFLGLGGMIETLSNFLPISVPPKAFGVDNVVLIQLPDTTEKARSSITSITQKEGQWILHTSWAGESSATTVEDIRDGKATTSQAIESTNLRLGGAIQRKKEFSEYYRALFWVAPLLSWKLLEGGDAAIRPISSILQIQLLQTYIDNVVDPATFGQDKCSDEQVDAYIRGYRNAAAATTLEQILFFAPGGGYLGTRYAKNFLEKQTLSLIPGTKITADNLLNKHFRRLLSVGVDPIELYKQRAAATALNYASACKDSTYKVLAFQRIPEKTPRADIVSSIKKKTADPLGISQITKGLNVGNAFAGLGAQVQQKELKEVLNVKTLLNDQNGMIRPSEIYYLQLDPEGSDMNWWGVFENQCFRNCLQQSDGTFACADGNGVYLERNGTRIDLANRERALMSDLIPSLGMVVPNKIISAPLNCEPSAVVLEAKRDASLNVIDGACPATDCAIKSLVRVSGNNVGNDLSKVLGPVQAIYTTQGVASQAGGQYRFVRTKGVKIEDAKTVLGVPALGTNTRLDLDKTSVQQGSFHTETSLAGTEERFSSVQIMGDGKVRGEREMGELLTIQMQNGVIHFDRTTRKLYVLLKVLATAPGRDVNGISASPATVSGPKADLERFARELDSLKAALASGTQLTGAQLELLKKTLEKGGPTGALLTKEERDKLAAILDKQSKGIALNQAESALLKKAQSEDKFPGVIVLSPDQTQMAEKSLKEQGVDAGLIQQLIDKLSAGSPLSTGEKNAVKDALDKSQKDGKLSADDANKLKADLEKTVPPAGRANEIANAASEDRLTAEQRALAEKAAKDAAADARKRAESASDAPIPAIKLGGVTAKTGAEESAQSLNRALEKIGGFTDITTEKTAVQFGTDANGQPVVRIANKETGATQELKVTGPATRDGNSVVIPTNQGPLKFDINVNKDNGAPIVNINGPGVSDSSPLIIAQGPGGLLFFDPKTGTWQALNGGAIGLDGAFGAKGISFYNSGNDGTRAIPQDSPFSYNRVLDSAGGSSPLLALPSWPQEKPWAAAMLALVLLAVVAIRFRRFD